MKPITVIFGALALLLLAPIPGLGQEQGPPTDCPMDSWVVAYQYQPETGQLHNRTDLYRWDEWVRGVPVDTLGNVVRIVPNPVDRSLLTVRVQFPNGGGQNFLLLSWGRGQCGFSSAVTRRDGYPWHLDFVRYTGEADITPKRSNWYDRG